MKKSEYHPRDNKKEINKIPDNYTVADIQRLLGMSPTTQWRERKDGNLTFRRCRGKVIYLKEDIENYLERNKHTALAVTNESLPLGGSIK